MRKATIESVRRIDDGDYVISFVELDDVFEISYKVAVNAKDASLIAAAFLADGIENAKGREGYINLLDKTHLKFLAELPLYYANQVLPDGKYTVVDVLEEDNYFLLKLRSATFPTCEVAVSKSNLRLFEKVLGTNLRQFISFNHKLQLEFDGATKKFFVDVIISIISSNNYEAELRDSK